MNVLAIDVGGTNIKFLVTGGAKARKFASGPTMTTEKLVTKIRKLTDDWDFDVVSIGYPGRLHEGKIIAEPHNLAGGWVGFDFSAAFSCPVRVVNDAAMQALGSYQRGLLLFLGFGTGLGSALVADGVVIPMELGHLSFGKGTYEDYVGKRGLERLGKKKWRRAVKFGVARLIDAISPDDVVLGGGNAKRFKSLPAGCRLGDNANAFTGGFRLWCPIQSE